MSDSEKEVILFLKESLKKFIYKPFSELKEYADSLGIDTSSITSQSQLKELQKLILSKLKKAKNKN